MGSRMVKKLEPWMEIQFSMMEHMTVNLKEERKDLKEQ